MAFNNEDYFVPVPVPRQLVLDVYRFVAERTRLTGEGQPSVRINQPAGLPDDWSASEIRRLYSDSAKNMRAILDAMAARPGEKVYSNDLIEVLSRSRGGTAGSSILGGTLGAFGRRVKNRYRKNNWPFEAHWIPEINQNYYVMSSAVATILKS